MADQVNAFFTDAEYQDSPLRALTDFLTLEQQNEAAKNLLSKNDFKLNPDLVDENNKNLIVFTLTNPKYK